MSQTSCYVCDSDNPSASSMRPSQRSDHDELTLAHRRIQCRQCMQSMHCVDNDVCTSYLELTPICCTSSLRRNCRAVSFSSRLLLLRSSSSSLAQAAWASYVTDTAFNAVLLASMRHVQTKRVMLRVLTNWQQVHIQNYGQAISASTVCV